MRVGAHESIAGGVSRALARAEEHGARSLQVFTKNARGWKAPPLTEEECRAFREEVRRTGLPVVAHGSYLVNLGTEEPAQREKSLDCVVEELTRCERLGIPFLILHPGGHPDERRGLAQVARALDEVHARTPRFQSRICLEVTAGRGTAWAGASSTWRRCSPRRRTRGAWASVWTPAICSPPGTISRRRPVTMK